VTDPATPQPTRTSNMGSLGLLIAVVALAVALFAVMQGGASQVPAAEGPSQETFRLSSDLLEGSNRYHPATLIAFEGDDITFEVTNRGADVHGFTVQGLGIEATVQAGETQQFSAPSVAAGVYNYFCHLHPGHIGGQLVVLSR
jgi:plastocyanin